MLRARTSLAAVAVAAALLTLSPTIGSAATKPRLQDVARATNGATTMAFGMDAQMTFTSAGKTVSGRLVGTGSVDRVKKSSAFTMDMSSFMTSILGASGQKLPKQLQDPAIYKMQVVGIGTKVYLSFPMLNVVSPTANAKPWVVVDAAQLGVSAADVAAAQGADPSQGLQYLNGLGTNATEVGKETLDGVATTHYRGAVTLSELLKNVPAADAAKAKAAFGSQSSLPVELWIDGEGRARRMDMAMKMNTQGTDMTMKVSYTFSKFGEPVNISAPPASQVSTAAENPALAAAIKQAAQKRKAAA